MLLGKGGCWEGHSNLPDRTASTAQTETGFNKMSKCSWPESDVKLHGHAVGKSMLAHAGTAKTSQAVHVVAIIHMQQ